MDHAPAISSAQMHCKKSSAMLAAVGAAIAPKESCASRACGASQDLAKSEQPVIRDEPGPAPACGWSWREHLAGAAIYSPGVPNLPEVALVSCAQLECST